VPKETAGFIDGDFVQRFADLDTATADKLLRGSTAVESVYKVTEHGKETATFPDVVRILEAAAGMH
jgi:DNA damage-binding protein 1